MEHEGGRDVGVTEEGDRGREEAEDLAGETGRQQIVVLVEGRPVADRDVLRHLDRSRRQVAEIAQVGLLEMLRRPAHGLLGGEVEALGEAQVGDHPIVVAAHDVDRLRQPSDHRHHAVGVGSVADQVAQHQHGVEVHAAQMPLHRRQGVPVAVDVGEDQVAHVAISSAARRRATISSTPSPAPISTTISAWR